MPRPGDRCVDLGASPGGWSWVLQSLGATVLAVDKAPLAPDIARLPHIEFLKASAFALDPAESVIIYRGFRDFVGPYVAHCHNLAHEDHAMMFGWEITP